MEIYLLTNKLNGKVYVGQTTRYIEDRWGEHKRDSKHYNSHLYISIRKYGIENFEVRKICQCLGQEDLNAAEVFLIWVLGSHKSCFGYNARLGGSPGCYSAEAKARFRELAKARPKEQHEAFCALGQKKIKELRAQGIKVGRTVPHKPESIQLMRDVKVGTTQTPESNAKRSKKMTGRSTSEEHRKNLSIGLTESWASLTEEEKQARWAKQSASLKKRNATPEAKAYWTDERRAASAERSRGNKGSSGTTWTTERRERTMETRRLKSLAKKQATQQPRILLPIRPSSH